MNIREEQEKYEHEHLSNPPAVTETPASYALNAETTYSVKFCPCPADMQGAPYVVYYYYYVTTTTT